MAQHGSGEQDAQAVADERQRGSEEVEGREERKKGTTCALDPALSLSLCLTFLSLLSLALSVERPPACPPARPLEAAQTPTQLSTL